MDYSLPGSSVHGIFQQEYWSGVPLPSPSLVIVNCEVAQSCPTHCNSTDYSLPGSPIHGIFQARILEWVAISFSRGSSRPRDQTWSPVLQADYTLSHQGSLINSKYYYNLGNQPRKEKTTFITICFEIYNWITPFSKNIISVEKMEDF